MGVNDGVDVGWCGIHSAVEKWDVVPPWVDSRLRRRYEADAPTLEVGEEADNTLHKPRYDGSLTPNH